VPVQGICLYPIVDYPGWDNERTCSVGLFSGANAAGRRTLCVSLARELHRQRQIFATSRSPAPVPTQAPMAGE
jgi:hypothetical protein